MNLGRRCAAYLCFMRQTSHLCRNLWNKPRNSVQHVVRSTGGLEYFRFRCYSSNSSPEANGVDEFEEVESIHSKILKGLETEDGILLDNRSDVDNEVYIDPVDSQHLEKQFTDEEVERVMELFKQRESVIKNVISEYNLDEGQFKEAMDSFLLKLKNPRELNEASSEIRLIVDNILRGKKHVDELIPIFMRYVSALNPLMGLKLELQKTSTLALPPAWFPEARSLPRRLIYHAGPTNSGKTHKALKSFMAADTAIYCAPLRMLAHEIFHRSNKEGYLCDLITGEERIFASGQEEVYAPRLSCTVEMASRDRIYDVAVIDEIQMIEDPERGGGWTRAFLGLPAREVHLCGHSCAIDIVQKLASSMGEKLEVHHYERLSPLVPLRSSLGGDYKRVMPGDCVVTFSRASVFHVRKKIEQATNQQCAVIYGGLPPAVRVKEAEKFNDPESPVNILVATDAIGMGLNLNIRRIVFHSLTKFDGNENSLLTSGHVKQIAGRAGRYGKEHTHGEVTAFDEKSMSTLHELLELPVEDVQKAGLYPSIDQIEMFSSYLPNAKFHEILNLFCEMATYDGNYFLCDVLHQIELASRLQGIHMPIRELHRFSLAPAAEKNGFTVKALVKFAYKHSFKQVVSLRELRHIMEACSSEPFQGATFMLRNLSRLETMHEIVDLYLWLSMRFPETFIAPEAARELQKEIEGDISAYIHSAGFRRGNMRGGSKGHSRRLSTSYREPMNIESETSQQSLEKRQELEKSYIGNQLEANHRRPQNSSRKLANVLKRLQTEVEPQDEGNT